MECGGAAVAGTAEQWQQADGAGVAPVSAGLPARARGGPVRPRRSLVKGPGRRGTARQGRGGASRTGRSTWLSPAAAGGLPRKEVIQPQLPLRLPCYDFVPVTRPTLGGCPPYRVGPPTSGVAGSHDVTGGVYKAREQIHRRMADRRLLATPPSRGRVAARDPNWGRVWGFAPPRGLAAHCPDHCSVRVAQGVRVMLT